MSKTNSTTVAAKQFCIIRETRAGMTWYQSKDVGTITRRVAAMWTTTDRDAAIQLAGEVGGTVVPVVR